MERKRTECTKTWVFYLPERRRVHCFMRYVYIVVEDEKGKGRVNNQRNRRLRVGAHFCSHHDINLCLYMCNLPVILD